LYQGKNDVIAQQNSQLALNCGKDLCAEFWKDLFVLSYPEEVKEPTL
jgi:hypothetical protein